MAKLSDKIDRLKKAAPKVSRYGQLYGKRSDLSIRYRRVTLYTLFVSDESTHLLRDHIFQKAEYLSGAQWHAWFSAHLTAIHENAVLPGIALRTSKQWAVQRIIGWAGNAKYALNRAAVGGERHSKKRKGGKNG